MVDLINKHDVQTEPNTTIHDVKSFFETCDRGLNVSVELFEFFKSHVESINAYINKYELFKHVPLSLEPEITKLRIEHLKQYHNLIKGN